MSLKDDIFSDIDKRNAINKHLIRRRENMENVGLLFDKETIKTMLRGVADSPPTISDAKHPPHWWNENFGKRIRSEWKSKIERVLAQIDRMQQPF